MMSDRKSKNLAPYRDAALRFRLCERSVLGGLI